MRGKAINAILLAQESVARLRSDLFAAGRNTIDDKAYRLIREAYDKAVEVENLILKAYEQTC